MDRHLQKFQDSVRRIFGDAARLDGCLGTETRGGEIRIILDHRTIGSGPTFEAALQAAQRNVGNEGSRMIDAAAFVA